MKSPKIGIYGVGWVGDQLRKYFEEVRGYTKGEDLVLYDIRPDRCAGDLNDADVVFVAVPTPRNPETGRCDVSILNEAAANIPGEKIVVLKSTIPPGTTNRFQEEHPQHKFLFNPEFLTESRAWEDMIRPDRQIVGFTDKSLDAAHLVLSLLPEAPFMSPWGVGTYDQTRISATEAEIIKYATNIHFARKVNWANALARFSENMGADYENIEKGLGADHRVGRSHLSVTHGGYRGFGGFCLPKDTSAFMLQAKDQGVEDVYALLAADWKFNTNLLAEQGLTVDDVSKHISDIDEVIQERRKSH